MFLSYESSASFSQKLTKKSNQRKMYPGFSNNTTNGGYPQQQSTSSYPSSLSTATAGGGYPTAANYPGVSTTTTASSSSNPYLNHHQQQPQQQSIPAYTSSSNTATSSYPSAAQYSCGSASTTTKTKTTTTNSVAPNPFNNNSAYPSVPSLHIASSYNAVGNNKKHQEQQQQQQEPPRAQPTVYSSSSAPSLYPSGLSATAYPTADSIYSMLASPKKVPTSSSSSTTANQSRPTPQQQSSSSSSSLSSKPIPPPPVAAKMRNPVHIPYITKNEYEEGKVKALFIGINYKGQNCELDGCVADVQRQLTTLERIGFPIDEAVILTDDPKFKNNAGMPTKANILYWMNWLTANCESGDVLFFHFSGHGVSKKQSSDTPAEEREASGYDQFVVPLDCERSGLIQDDELFEILVRRLKPGVRGTFVVDACKSGSIIDVQFEYREDSSSSSSSAYGGFSRLNNKKHGGGDVVVFSAASDFQTAADVDSGSSQDKMAGGAFTKAFGEALTKTAGLTFIQLLQEIRRSLRKQKFTQIPQLSATRPIDVNKPFSLFGTLERVQIQTYQAPAWAPPKNVISYERFGFPDKNASEWTPPSSTYNVSEAHYPSALSVLSNTTRGSVKSVY